MRRFRPQIPAEGIVGAIFIPIGLIMLRLFFSMLKMLRTDSVPEGVYHPAASMWLFFGAAALMLGFGVPYFVKAVRAVLVQKRVFENGVCTYAEFVRAVEQTNISVFGRHPYAAVLRCDDGRGGERVLRSRRLWKDPTEQLAGRQIAVYVDENDPERYYVDLESVL